jgi:hypothetical protein
MSRLVCSNIFAENSRRAQSLPLPGPLSLSQHLRPRSRQSGTTSRAFRRDKVR